MSVATTGPPPTRPIRSQAGDDGLLARLRARWPTSLMLTHPDANRETRLADIEKGRADIVSIGKMLLANPDLVARIRAGAPPAEFAGECVPVSNEGVMDPERACERDGDDGDGRGEHVSGSSKSVCRSVTTEAPKTRYVSAGSSAALR